MSTEKLRRAALPPVQEVFFFISIAFNVQINKCTRNRRKPEELNAGKKVNSRKILMQFEQDQKEKYEKAIAALTEMEKRAVMAESMEEATLHYHSGKNKAKPSLSPRPAGSTSSTENLVV
ncbi:hypothetical protein V6Z11_D06G086600 [Gossypium hirsutum]